MEGRRTLAGCLSYVMEHFLWERKEKGRYWLYRVIDCYESPKMYSLRGALDERFLLDPSEYLAYGPKGIPMVGRARDFPEG